MFCPSCRSEFRAGFTHCASCDVDLVESLDGPGVVDLPMPGAASAPKTASYKSGLIPEQPPVAFCGFLAIEEATEARAKLRAQGVKSEILIREDEPVAGEPAKDTYWLRLSPAFFKKAADLLGYDDAAVESSGEEEEGEMVACSACGEDVGADETFCPHCGARFEEG